MNVRPEVLEILRQWVRKAEHDLEAVRRIMAVDEGCPYDTACFHCQQAIEKYLKALLTLSDVSAPILTTLRNGWRCFPRTRGSRFRSHLWSPSTPTPLTFAIRTIGVNPGEAMRSRRSK